MPQSDEQTLKNKHDCLHKDKHGNENKEEGNTEEEDDDQRQEQENLVLRLGSSVLKKIFQTVEKIIQDQVDDTESGNSSKCKISPVS